MKQIAFIRKKYVLGQVSYSNSTLYRRIKERVFPPPVKISRNVHAWIKDEVDATLALISTGATNEELERLVSDLLEDRNAGGE